MRRLTQETALWGAIALLAALPRLLNLHFPLVNAEAALALQALAGAKGVAVAFPNPLFGTAQLALFAAFGASDVGARVIPALAGVALCLAPILGRSAISRTRAMLIGLLLALSPTLWFVSREATGAMLAWALAACAVFAWMGMRRVLAAILFGVLLACGHDAVVPTIVALITATIAGGLVVPSRRMLMAGGVAFLIAATALLLRPSGLGDAFNGWAQWFQGLSQPESLSFGRLALGFATTEIVLMAGALVGLVTLVLTRRFAGQAAPWLASMVAGLALLLMDSQRTVAALVPVVLGCAGLASHAFDRLWAGVAAHGRWTREGVIAGLVFVLMVYAGLGLRQYAGQGQSSWLFPIVIAGLLILAIIAAGSLGLEYSVALRGTALGLLASMLLYTLGMGFQLNLARHDNPGEPYRAEVTLDGLSTLTQTLRDISTRATGEPGAMRVTVADDAPASLRWALRDQNVGREDDLNPSAELTPAQGKPRSGSFVGIAFDVTSRAALNNVGCPQQGQGGINCQPLARWLAFREADTPQVDRWLLWVRDDVAARASGQR